MGQDGEKSGTIYLLLGCAGLLIVGLCVATGVGIWLVLERAEPPPGPGPAVAVPAVPQPPLPFEPPKPPVDPIEPPRGPALPPPPAFGATPLVIRANVDEIDGSRPVEPGVSCEMTVERHTLPSPPGFWCRTQILCGGKLLYGGPQAGYFYCDWSNPAVRHVRGEDGETYRIDNDAAMALDTRAQTLTIRDDDGGAHGAYTLRARVTEVR